VAAPVVVSVVKVDVPDAVNDVRVVAPVTFTVDENVAAPACDEVPESVVAPETPNVLAKLVAPVTPSVPPTVPLFVTLTLVKVEVPAVKVDDKVVAPVTPNVPPTVVAPSVDAPADKVEEKVPVAALKLPVKLKDVPVATPMTGVIKVGVFANTNEPLPVSSVIAANKLALVGVAKYVATPVPNPLTPVEIGKPVPLVKVTDVGIPKIGVTNVGLVDNTKLPDPVDVVTPVPPLATAIVVALQIPEVMVPTLVKLEPVTVDFNVVPLKVPASAIIEADPAAVRRPLASTVNVGIAVVDP
jgi:hypothetical protein